MKGIGMLTHILNNNFISPYCGCINDDICKGYINSGCKPTLIFYDYCDIKECKGYNKEGN